MLILALMFAADHIVNILCDRNISFTIGIQFIKDVIDLFNLFPSVSQKNTFQL